MIAFYDLGSVLGKFTTQTLTFLMVSKLCVSIILLMISRFAVINQLKREGKIPANLNLLFFRRVVAFASADGLGWTGKFDFDGAIFTVARCVGWLIADCILDA